MKATEVGRVVPRYEASPVQHSRGGVVWEPGAAARGPVAPACPAVAGELVHHAGVPDLRDGVLARLGVVVVEHHLDQRRWLLARQDRDSVRNANDARPTVLQWADGRAVADAPLARRRL